MESRLESRWAHRQGLNLAGRLGRERVGGKGKGWVLRREPQKVTGLEIYWGEKSEKGKVVWWVREWAFSKGFELGRAKVVCWEREKEKKSERG